jgi:hypothetical protein
VYCPRLLSNNMAFHLSTYQGICILPVALPIEPEGSVALFSAFAKRDSIDGYKELPTKLTFGSLCSYFIAGQGFSIHIDVCPFESRTVFHPNSRLQKC